MLRGDDLGPLHGVPMTIKDSFQTDGLHHGERRAPQLPTYVPTEDAWPVARLREAGAIPFAKTNLPMYAGDIQTYNEVYGTTNNPYDTSRTPGGSSGGSAAALAMGFTPIESGQRHRRLDPGAGALLRGDGAQVELRHRPGPRPDPRPARHVHPADITSSGPMARYVGDLELELGVLAGPTAGIASCANPRAAFRSSSSPARS